VVLTVHHWKGLFVGARPCCEEQEEERIVMAGSRPVVLAKESAMV
jgi:hypothetical protein